MRVVAIVLGVLCFLLLILVGVLIAPLVWARVPCQPACLTQVEYDWDLLAEAPSPTQAKTPESEEPTTEASGTEPETAGPIWSDADAFNSLETEYPMGDNDSWTYFQVWDGSNPSTALHVATAPKIVVVVRNYVGTRWQIWGGPDLVRWEEMRHECRTRDQLPETPPLVVIETTTDNDIGLLPDSWSVLPFPG